MEEDAAPLSNPPTVDAAVTRLAKNVTLPMEDSSSFRDILDRRIEIDLRKFYLAVGGALTSVASEMRVWAQNLEYAIKNQLPKEKKLARLLS